LKSPDGKPGKKLVKIRNVCGTNDKRKRKQNKDQIEQNGVNDPVLFVDDKHNRNNEKWNKKYVTRYDVVKPDAHDKGLYDGKMEGIDPARFRYEEDKSENKENTKDKAVDF
jgi:hypothetical protein